MTGQLNIANSTVHSQDLRRAADAGRLLGTDSDGAVNGQDTQVVIRAATPDDEAALERLAQLEGRRRPQASVVLLAEIDGEVHAALPLDHGPAIADPFRPTVELVGMLKLRAAQLRGESVEGGRLRRAWASLRGATSRPVMAPLAGDVSLPVRHDGE
jgi:hypothetical protein